MSAPSMHDDWLSLIEISGPFLAVPVLKEAFPQGLEELDATKRKRLRQAYEEWREALELEDAQFPELHVAWIDEVLSRGLELDEDGKGDVLKRADWCAARLNVGLPQHGVTLSPEFAVIDEQHANKPLLLIQTYAHEIDLDGPLKQDGWAARPADRMVQLCRSLGCRLGLVTNGERWMLVDAPVGAVTTFASWYARFWSQEPVTLQAFVHLLGIRRFFVDESEQLSALFDRSLKFQDEVTDALGEQVRRAVEVLIQTLDKADQDRNRELLQGVKEPELYEAALTVMMRLVFLLSAEERGLLLMGDERYEANYAVSTLRMQLRKESEEILERRWDAWSRLLAIFRMVFGGIEHENLRLPPLGGSLFDPDRFTFLEGRTKGSSWRISAAKPLPIDNRTVLLLLEAIQQFQGRTLSYRALDVEQIGYVYEGLLERTVKRTDEVTLELDSTKSAKTPWVKLAELDSARLGGAERLTELLQERSGSSASRVRNDLTKPVHDALADRLLIACQGDSMLRDRVKPYVHLLRTDPWGYPLVYPARAFIVTTGSDRHETGTHYTPKSLTEAIVAETLTPVAYFGQADGIPREQWALKSPAELLDLKICDPAMGSGAFLVQACRWLSDRLVEAWSQVEASGKIVSVDGKALDAWAAEEPLPRDSEARTVIARRLVAERCLYGVDLNPLAVELAKLSIWLVTLAQGRPFGFLDHNLRCGDSLLGLHQLGQLTKFSLHPEGKKTKFIFASDIEDAVKVAIALRKQLRDTPIRNIGDVQYMERLDQEARGKLEHIEHIADAMIGELLASSGNQRTLNAAMDNLSIWAAAYIEGNAETGQELIAKARKLLSIARPEGKAPLKPFHWPLEFPEVFECGGFDAVIGNPPFLGNRKITRLLGESYRTSVVDLVADSAVGAVDLVVYFLRRSNQLISNNGTVGHIATDSVSEGDNSIVGLKNIVDSGATIFRATKSMPWPGSASVYISIVFWTPANWLAEKILNNRRCDDISFELKAIGSTSKPPEILKSKIIDSFVGVIINGDGFILSPDEAKNIISADPKSFDVIKPYVNGDDINSNFRQIPKNYVISFGISSRSDAEKYYECFKIVTEKVKPYRDTITKQIHESDYWKFWDKRLKSFEKISTQKRVLVAARASKDVQFTWVDNNQVFSDQVVLITTGFDWAFALLQSSIHRAWAWDRCTGMYGSGIRYAPTKAIATFPIPEEIAQLERIGADYFKLRSECELHYSDSLTALYNRFHDASQLSGLISSLRDEHIKMDQMVAAAYGWKNLDLSHGFYETSHGIRFTISENARLEVLQRLLKLNHKRYEEEVTARLNGKANTKKSEKARKRVAQITNLDNDAQPSFDFGKDDE